MPHLAEDSSRLPLRTKVVSSLAATAALRPQRTPSVVLMWFPAGRSDKDASEGEQAYSQIARIASGLHERSTLCVLTTPPDAARMVRVLDRDLTYQLWVAVKTRDGAGKSALGQLHKRHVALLVYTRYSGSLMHVKTRVAYTYCAACRRTTKDYGGKKHLYHEYGTLLSDVWRDIDCDPAQDIGAVIDRLRDLFGVGPYKDLLLLDMRNCSELGPYPVRAPSEVTPTRHTSGPSNSKDSRLLLGDCLEKLASIPNDSVDFCFADPPYNLKKKYDRWDDALELVNYFSWCDQWLGELCRILKPGRTLAVMNIPHWAARHYQHLAERMVFQDWIAWDGLSFPVRLIMPAHYAILCFSKGQARPLPGFNQHSPPTERTTELSAIMDTFCSRPNCVGSRTSRRVVDSAPVTDLWVDIHRLKHNSRRVDHPCQLPPRLMRRLLEMYTAPGELVLDCFDGAGTTTLVAHQMDRRFLGIELSEQYHQIALARHAQIDRGEDPFGKRTDVPTSKNSPVQRIVKQDYIISKKALQLEVRRIANQLGHLPSRVEVATHSRFPAVLYDKYFVSWGEVCAAARTTGMSEFRRSSAESTQQQVLDLVPPSHANSRRTAK
jgi:DNA modification methylase